MRRRIKRPSPAMAVAMAALVVAVVGTAIAAPAALNKAETKQVKKIARSQANQQIGKLGPGLSVASAGTADTANTASSAGTANTVENGAIGTAQLASTIPAASAYTTGQTITSGSHTIVALNGENYDTAGMHDNVFDNSRVTAPVDGIYAANGLVEWEADTSGARLLRLQKNGSVQIASVNQAPVTAATAQSVTAYVALAAGEYVEMLIFQDSGGPLDLSPPQNASLQLTWQAPG
jgi:hypothetical protein